MSIPSSLTPLFSTGSSAAAAEYQIERSLRFNSADSAYLSRTPAVAGDRKKWTWAAWAKRSSTVNSKLFYIQTGSAQGGIEWTNTAQIGYFNSPTNYSIVKTTGVFRDFSAWYHIVVALDAVNTSLKIYVNGVEQALTVAAPIINENHNINNTVEHNIGKEPTASEYFDGYLADIHFIDGQALDHTSFTEVSATTGQLIPLAYTGTFGTNGFWLKFSDNSALTSGSNVGVGKDYSGNANYFNTSGLSVTAGAGNDSLVDTPTSYGTPDTGVGGEVRGNYATFNPLANKLQNAGTTVTLSNGNLDIVGAASNSSSCAGTFGVSSGKWYFEYTVVAQAEANDTFGFGIRRDLFTGTYDNWEPYFRGTRLRGSDNGFYVAESGGDFLTLTSNGTVVGIAFDIDTNYCAVYVNGTIRKSSSSAGLSGYTWFPYVAGDGGGAVTVNFGQRPFAYQTPGTNRPAATFLALCDTNLGAPLIAKGNTVMDVLVFAATNANNTSITGLNFQPDLVWGKSQTNAYGHQLYDSVRGVNKSLKSNTTDAEGTDTNGVTSFDSNGFTAGVDFNAILGSGSSVAWAWYAGATTDPSNQAGSITSQVRANASAGFSVVTWTGNGQSNATVGHGQGVAPAFIVTVSRDGGSNWNIYHKSLATNNRLFFTTSAAVNVATSFNGGGIGPGTSTTLNFTQGTSNVGNANANGVRYLAYVWSEVVGYSSFGSYTGNYSADGPFVYTGFRPRWLLIKCSSTSGFDWRIFDTSRSDANGANVVNYKLYPNSSAQENDPSLDNANSNNIDILSNGFKLRTANGATNDPQTYIYAAFAENPFQYSRAR